MINVTDLETMDRAALIAAWASTFGTPVPKGLSRNLLRLFLATELQSRMYGKPPARIHKALAKQDDCSHRSAAVSMEPGGRLLREWNGVTHVVDVTEDGYRWNGQTWRSLSAIARAITGAHWSGPRFFGLNGKVGS
ncbi:DUF2924 domain-containing protein [Oceanomicrobium pacificus]|uniref:DUF2924 domain-containing protein n=1 Tax=Oceanomicrobium pacificus TaxID=2692916 RepID=A0A6B0U012_9RHOB|nr:DUF2924 domain-containing protein [Oceanomicrobium pacificus]MXU66593.1 DUF2924 domain-containing protein [Oceanomicrobium pacificus]